MRLFVRPTGNGASNVVQFLFRPHAKARRHFSRKAHSNAEARRQLLGLVGTRVGAADQAATVV
jgi:hypothetical protein